MTLTAKKIKNNNSSDIQFYSSLADAKDYPAPKMSMLPGLSASFFWGGDEIEEKNSIFLGNGDFFQEGRYALFRALLEAGVREGDVVCMPAYHCRSLVEPAIYLGAKIFFYSVDSCLHPNLDDISQHLIELDGLVKVIVLPHYFGFPQNMSEIVSFCEINNICLIEDCAHAYFGSYEGRMLGSFGEFAIASPRKFFPVEDGGVFVDNRSQVYAKKKLVGKPIVSEIKTIVRMLLSLLKSGSAASEFDSVPILPDKISVKSEADVLSDCKLEEFDPFFAKRGGSLISKLIIKNVSHAKICAYRRANYVRWLEGVVNLNGCHALYSFLPDDVVPYVFPLVIEQDANYVFGVLKELGVPVWRWEDFAVSKCDVSLEYRRSLIQLPCHQGLSEKQVNWMISIIQLIMTEKNTHKNLC